MNSIQVVDARSQVVGMPHIYYCGDKATVTTAPRVLTDPKRLLIRLEIAL